MHLASKLLLAGLKLNLQRHAILKYRRVLGGCIGHRPTLRCLAQLLLL